MQCPKCRKEGLRYKEKKVKHSGKQGRERYTNRKDWTVFCSKCGYFETPAEK